MTRSAEASGRPRRAPAGSTGVIATSSFACGFATGRHDNVSSTLTIVVVAPIPTPRIPTSVREGF
jgi:hypothetical protein